MRQQRKNYINRQLISIILSVFLVGFGFYAVSNAFNGPGSPGGSGSGAIGVDGSNNMSFGTSTPSSTTKVLIVASSTSASEYALRVIQPAGTPLFMIRNDGNIGISTSTPTAATLTIQGNAYASGGFSGNLSASYVTANTFAAGNFAFPANLAINTTTAVSLPANFVVYGNARVTGSSTVMGNLGFGTTTPSYLADINGAMRLVPTSTPTGANGVMYYDSGTNKFRCYENGAFANCVGSGGGTIGGSGTSTQVAYWSASSTLTSSGGLYWNNASSSLGVGTSSPAYKLDVAGTGRFTGDVILGDGSGTDLTVGSGSGKIDVGTVDPVYTINGVKYATYLSGITGVKEETAGLVLLRKGDLGYSYTIDFNKQPVGSDLWLFGKAADIKRQFSSLTVILSPAFEGKAWYKKDPAALTLTFFGKPESAEGDLEVSYRLTAPRFDASSWTNFSTNSNAQGFIINE